MTWSSVRYPGLAEENAMRSVSNSSMHPATDSGSRFAATVGNIRCAYRLTRGGHAAARLLDNAAQVGDNMNV